MVTYHNVLIQNDQLQELYTKKFPLIRREPTQKHRERNEACNILLLRHIHPTKHMFDCASTKYRAMQHYNQLQWWCSVRHYCHVLPNCLVEQRLHSSGMFSDLIIPMSLSNSVQIGFNEILGSFWTCGGNGLWPYG